MYSNKHIENIMAAQATLSKHSAHLLNGQMMFEQFKQHGLMTYGEYAPFNEAMCFGEVDDYIFNEDFISKRCATHHVSEKDYETITLKPLTELLNSNFETLVLWFGTDMFCQINLLTVLAYLEKLGFNKQVVIHVFDEDSLDIRRVEVELNCFQEIYQTVVIKKHDLLFIPFHELAVGIQLYLAYQAKDNELTTFIQKHVLLSDSELLTLLFKTFQHYGLGDTQYLTLIERIKKSHV